MIICPFADLNRYASIIPGLEEAVNAIHAMETWQVGTIPLSDGNRIMVQENQTRPVTDDISEAHRKFLDIQYVVKGEETVGWAPLNTLTPAGEFSEEKDVGMYAGKVEFVRVTAGNCYVVFPEDAHMPGVTLGETAPVHKLVIKLKV